MTGFEAPVICIAAAVAKNGIIGRDGKLPWHIPADLERFRMLTGSYPVIMGRKTFDSLPGFLSGRMHLVVTSNPGSLPAGAFGFPDPDAALAYAKAMSPMRIWIIGGEKIYTHFLPMAEQIDITHVDLDADGDASFPAFNPDDYDISEYGNGEAAGRDGGLIPYRFRRYEKRLSQSGE